MTKVLVTESYLSDIADAIRAKKHISEITYKPSQMSSAIRSIPETKNSVNFYDFDGTLLYSYTTDEFLALNSLPSAPTNHSGLTSLGWNWDYSNAINYVQANYTLDIGAMYKSYDNATKIGISLFKGRLSPYLSFAVSGTATIDWGDGSSPETVQGGGGGTLIAIPHTYSFEGSYTISISSSSTVVFFGDSNGCRILGAQSAVDDVYKAAITSFIAGSNVSYGNYAFYKCNNIQNIILGDSVFNANTSYVLSYCRNLRCCIMPKGCAVIPDYCFYYCISLSNAILPQGTGPGSSLNIGQLAFCNCYSLERISVNGNLGDYALMASHNLKEVCLSNSITSLGVGCLSNCETLSFIVIPESISYFDHTTFAACNSLTDVMFIIETPGAGPQSFPLNAFKSCFSIRYFSIPDSVVQLGNSVFDGCSAMVEVNMPPNLTSIGTTVFNNCKGLACINFSRANSVPALSGSLGNSLPNDFVIVVPDSLYNQWIGSSSWSNYASKIIKASLW